MRRRVPVVLRRGFVHRTMSALFLCALFGLLLVIPSVSSETEAQLHGNASLYSHWHEGALEETSELLLDEDIAGESADFSVGSFSLHRPQSELFMKGLLGELYDIAAATTVEDSDIENYLQARARAQIMNTAPPDFKQWLSSRGEGVTERIFVNSADYLTDYLTAAAVDNAEGLNFIRTIEWDYQSSLGDRRWQTGISALGALREGADDTVAWQLRGYAAEDSGVGANAGLIYRRAVDLGGEALVGANVFLDYEENGDYGEDFLRWSAGAEYRNAHLDIYLNRYFPISDGVLHDGDYLYTQGGEEAYINLKIPEFSIGKFSAGFTYYRWEGKYGDADDKGLRYHIRYSPHWYDWRFELEVDSPDGETPSVGGRINYRHIIGGAQKGVGVASAHTAFDARAHFFESVRREYAQRIRRSNEKNRIVVARVLDDSSGTAELAILETASPTAATVVTLSAVNGVGETHTLTLSARTISITVEAGTTLQLSASSWMATIYEGGMDRLADSGGRLELVTGKIFIHRFGDGLNTLMAGEVTVALVGTEIEAGVNEASARYDAFGRLVEGNISLTAAMTNQISLQLSGLAATAFVDLPPSFFPPGATSTTLSLILGCSTPEQRDEHRIFQDDYSGCPGDVRISDLATDRTVYLHAQGRDLTLAGVAGGSIAIVEAGITSSIVYGSYPFHPQGATLQVLNDAVSISHGSASGELAELAVEVDSNVAFAFVDSSVAATATAAVSIYAAVFGGTVSGIGAADNQVGCLNHLAPRSEGLVSVITSCSAIGFPNAGDSLDVVGRVGIERTYEVEVAGGTGEYAFELVGADSTMALAAPTGSAAVLVISPDTVPSDKISYRLRVSPLPSDDEEILFVEPAELDVYLRVLEGFRLINPAAPGFIRTEIDEDLPLYRVLHEGSVDNQVDIDLCLCLDDFIPNTTTEHPFRKYFAVDIDNQEVKVETAIPPEEIAGTAGITGRGEPTLADSPVDVPVMVAATDVHTSDDQLTAVESLSFVVTVRHPSGDVQSTYNYAGAVRNGDYAVYVRGAGDDILAFSDTGNAPDSNGVSVSGISVGGHYRYGFVGAAPSGFVLVTSAAPGAFAALQVDGNAPPSAGQHRMTVQIEDNHSLTEPFLVTVSVQMVDALALTAVPAGVEKSAPHRVDEELLRVQVQGGLAPYRYDIVGGNDSDHAKIAADAGDAGIGVVRLAKAEDEHTELALAIRVTDSKGATVDVTVPVTLLAGVGVVADPPSVERSAPHAVDEYLFRVEANGGLAPYSYAIASGNEGREVKIAAEGTGAVFRIEREVTDHTELVLVIRATDSKGATGDMTVPVTLLAGVGVVADPPSVERSAPHAIDEYLFRVEANGGLAPYSYAIASGNEGREVKIAAEGTGAVFRIEREVTDHTELVLVIRATDSKGATGDMTVPVTLLAGVGVVADPPSVERSAPHAVDEYLFRVEANGGLAPYSYAIASGNEGREVKMAADGTGAVFRIAQAVTEHTELNLRIEATDSKGITEGVTVPVTLLAGVGVVADPTGVEKSAPHAVDEYLFRVAANGGLAPYSYAIASGNEGGEVKMATDGTGAVFHIAREVTDHTELNLRIEATDSKGITEGVTVPVTLLAGVGVVADPTGVEKSAPHVVDEYLFRVAANGGLAPYSYAIASGNDGGEVKIAADGTGAVFHIAREVTDHTELVLVIRATDNKGATGDVTVPVTLLAGVGVVADPTGVEKSAPHVVDEYLFRVAANGGLAPYSYAIASGNEGGEVKMAADGTGAVFRIAQAVTEHTELNLRIEATDSKGITEGVTVPVTLLAGVGVVADPTGVEKSAPHAVDENLFRVEANGGLAPYSYAIASGNDGGEVKMAADGAGAVFRIAQAVTDHTELVLVIRATDSKDITEEVTVPVILLAGVGVVADPTGVEKSAPHVVDEYLFRVEANGGLAPYSYAIASGNDGGEVKTAADGTGAVFHIAREVTDHTELVLVIRATDNKGATGDVTVPVTLLAGVGVVADPTGVEKSAPHVVDEYLFRVAANGGLAPYSYAIASGNEGGEVKTAADGTGAVFRIAQAVTEHTELNLRIEATDSKGITEGVTVPVTLLAGVGVVADPTGVEKSAPHVVDENLFRVEANGGLAPYSYAIASGNEGGEVKIAADGTGAVFHIAREVTDHTELNLRIEATDSKGITEGVTVPVTLLAGVGVSADPTGVEKSAPHVVDEYLFRVEANGGLAPYSYSIASGNEGGEVKIAADGTGAVFHIAREVMEHTELVLVIRATDNKGATGDVTVPVTLLAGVGVVADPTGVEKSAPHAVDENLFRVAANGGLAPYSYAIASGNDGGEVKMATDGTGAVFHIAREVTDHTELNLRIEATDSKGITEGVTVPVTLLAGVGVSADPSSVEKSAPHVVDEYLFRVEANGGLAPYSYSIASGNEGGEVKIAADGTGAVFHIAREVTDHTELVLVIRATDNKGATGDVTVPVTLLAGVGVSADPSSVEKSAPHVVDEYLFRVEANGGLAPYSYAIVSGNEGGEVKIATDGTGAVFHIAREVTDHTELNLRIEATDSKGITEGVTVPVTLLAGVGVSADPSSVEKSAPHVVDEYLFRVEANGGLAPYSYSIASGNEGGEVKIAADGTGAVFHIAREVTDHTELVLVIRATDSKGVTEEVTVPVTLLAGLALTDPGEVISGSPHGEDKVLFEITASGGKGGENGINYGYALLTTAQDKDLLEVVGSGLNVTVRLAEEVTDLPRGFEVTVQLSDGGSSPIITRKVTVDLLDGLALTEPRDVEFATPHSAGKVLFTITASGGNGGADGVNYRYALLTTEQDNGLLQILDEGGEGLSVTVALLNEVQVSDTPREFAVTVELSDGISREVARVVAVTLLPTLVFSELRAFDPALRVDSAEEGWITTPLPDVGDELLLLAATGGDGNYTYAINPALEGEANVLRINDNNRVELSQAVELATNEMLRIEMTLEVTDTANSPAATKTVTVDLLSHLVLRGPTEKVRSRAPHKAGGILFVVEAAGGAGNYNYGFLNSDLVGVGLEDGRVTIAQEVSVRTDIALNIGVVDHEGIEVDDQFAVEIFPPLVVTGPATTVTSTFPHAEGRDLFSVVAVGGTEVYSYSISEVKPSALSRNFGIGTGGTVTLAATVAALSTATVKIAVDDTTGAVEITATVVLMTSANHLLAIGGVVEGGQDNNQVWRSSDGQNWTQLPTPPSSFIFDRRHEHAAAVLGGTVYISGGCCKIIDNVPIGYDDVWASTDGVRWTLKSTGKFPGRIGHAMFAYGGTLFVTGGSDPFNSPSGERYRADIWYSDNKGVDWTQIADTRACSNRRGLVPFVYNNRVLLAGGDTETNDPDDFIGFATDVRSFNGENCGGSLGNLPAQAVADFDHDLALTAIQSKGVVFGGLMHIVGGQPAVAWSSSNGSIWTKHPGPLPFSVSGLSDHAMAVHDNRIFITGIGGSDLKKPAAIWSSSNGVGWDLVANSNLPARYSHVLVAMGPQLLVPRPAAAELALLAPSGVVKSTSPYTVGGEVFAVTAVGGAGGYEYSVVEIDVESPSTAEDKDYVTINADTGVVDINEEVAVSTRIRVLLRASDGSAVEDTYVQVDLLAPLTLTAPTEVVKSQHPHAESGQLFAVEASGGDTSDAYEYSIVAADSVSNVGIDAASGIVTINAEVAVSTRIEMTVQVTDAGDDTFSAKVTVDLLPPQNHRVLVIGGQVGPGYVSNRANDVWASGDGANWTLQAAVAGFPALSGHAAAADTKGTVYISGGTTNGSNVLNNVWYSDNGGKNWLLRTTSESDRFPPRRNHKMLAYGNDLYVIGGIGSGGTILSDTWRSRDGGLNWTRLGEADALGHDAESFVAFIHNGRLIVAGGRGRESSEVETEVRNLILENNIYKWESLGNLPSFIFFENPSYAHANAAGAVFNNKMYIFDGYGGRRVYSSEDGATWEQENIDFFGNIVVGHKAAALENKLLIIAGIATSNSPNAPRYDDVWSSAVNDITSWTRVAVGESSPTPRFDHAVAVRGPVTPLTDEVPELDLSPPLRERVLIIGGRTVSGSPVLTAPEFAEATNDVWASTAREGADWVNLATLATEIFTPRYGHAAAELNGTVYVSGGTIDGDDRIDTVWASADGGINWSIVSRGRAGLNRAYHKMIAHDGDLYIIGGTGSPTRDSNGNITNTNIRNHTYRSRNGGKTWSELSSDVETAPAETLNNNRPSFAVFSHQGRLLAAGGRVDINADGQPTVTVAMIFTTREQANPDYGEWYPTKANGLGTLPLYSRDTIPYVGLAGAVFNDRMYILDGDHIYSATEPTNWGRETTNSLPYNTTLVQGGGVPLREDFRRVGHQLAVINGKLLLIGGVYNTRFLHQTLDIFSTTDITNWQSEARINAAGRYGHAVVVVPPQQTSP